MPQPRSVFEFARQHNAEKRTDWEAVKDDIMLQAVFVKFQSHPYLLQLLLSTNIAILVEHSPVDSYWGDGGNGTGRNQLGKILMKIREKLAAKY